MYSPWHWFPRPLLPPLPSHTETNLKKQGMLPLTFTDPADYDRVQPFDRISLLGLADLAPGKVNLVCAHKIMHQSHQTMNHIKEIPAHRQAKIIVVMPLARWLPNLPPPPLQPVKCVLKHEDGSSTELMLQHTMNEAQISWFQAGSALNKMAEILKWWEYYYCHH